MDLMYSDLLKASLKLLSTAVTLDYQKQYKKALVAYMEGVPLLLQLAKKEELNSETKQLLKLKCHLYMDRIQIIKGEEIPHLVTILKEHPIMDNVKECYREFMHNLSHIPLHKVEEVQVAAPVKEFLWKNIVVPMMFPGFPGSVTCVKRGILLYGLPGTGKTMLLSALAVAVSCPFFRVSPYDLLCRRYGIEYLLHQVKEMFSFAVQNQPCILCIDDFEGLCVRDSDTGSSITRAIKEEIISQLTTCAEKQVTVIAATQAPWYLDGNLRQLFDQKFFLPLPTCEERIKIIAQQLASVRHQLSDDDLQHIGERTSGYTGSDITVVVKSCQMAAIRTLSAATHFRKILSTCFENGKETPCEMMTPCEPHEPGAIEITVEFLNPERVQEPPLTLCTVEKEIDQARPSCADLEIQKINQWHDEFCQKD